MNSSDRVLLYQDYVFNNGVLRNKLQKHFGLGTVIDIDADHLCEALAQKPKLFVMPGGADLYYCEKLGQDHHHAIKDFVYGGGSFLGLCAGAYYACDSLDWNCPIHDEVIDGERPLKFHGGRATGPIQRFRSHKEPLLSYDDVVSIKCEDDNQSFECLYRAGPIFEEGYGETVWARYDQLDNQPAAIIEQRHGKGRIILMSPHLEFSHDDWARNTYTLSNNKLEHDLSLVARLAPFKTQTETLWSKILNYLAKA